MVAWGEKGGKKLKLGGHQKMNSGNSALFRVGVLVQGNRKEGRENWPLRRAKGEQGGEGSGEARTVTVESATS